MARVLGWQCGLGGCVASRARCADNDGATAHTGLTAVVRTGSKQPLIRIMAKQITVECRAPVAALLSEALRWFVASHYPHGADECSIAARETLLDLARRFDRELANTGRCDYSSRVRAFLTEALNSYTHHLEAEQSRSWEHRRALLIAVCRGQSNGEGYAAAESCDMQPPAAGG